MLNPSQLDTKNINSRKLFNGLALRADIALILVIGIAEAEIFFRGFDWRLGGLITVSLLSILILFSIARGARNQLVMACSYLPYLFGLYLFFMEGFYRLTQLIHSFSIEEVLLIIFYFYIGSSIASVGYHATLQVKRLRQSH